MGTMLVRHDAASASEVRRELALDLDLHGVDGAVIDEVSLVASELIGNAVRHTRAADDSDLDVTWTVGPDGVLLSVEDPSRELPVVREAPPEATGGRGMRIIDTLAVAWGVEPTQHGKRVWARIPI
ncbi:MAG: ATP-binding protein [Jatrophihabitantaceae bacterium]